MEKPKKKQGSKNNNWLCEHCKKRGKESVLGEFARDNVIKIRGPVGQEYEVGFTYIEVTCPKCGKKCRLESKKLRNVQKYLEHLKKNEKSAKLALDSGEAELRAGTVRPLNEIGLKSFYSLEDRHERILKSKLTEWQKKIYDYLCSMGLESDISNSEDWDRVTQAIKKKLNMKQSIVEKNIIKINKEISKILRTP